MPNNEIGGNSHFWMGTKLTLMNQMHTQPNNAFNGFEYFFDSCGNRFPLLKGLRDQLKPGWQSMLGPGPSEPKAPGHDVLTKNYRVWQNRVTQLNHLIRMYSLAIQDRHVLEIGTYGGAAAFAMAASGSSRVTGTDIPRYYVNDAPGGRVSKEKERFQSRKLSLHREAYRKLLGPDISDRVFFLEDDICASRLPSESIDFMVSWEVIEHLSDPGEAFRQMHRILKPGGVGFHEYNPFYSLMGGHSLCTLDFLWGHARLSESDFKTYLTRIRPTEYHFAIKFYHDNLNRLTLVDLREHITTSGFDLIAMLPWPNMEHLKLLDGEILEQCIKVNPKVQVMDLITPSVWVLIQKRNDKNHGDDPLCEKCEPAKIPVPMRKRLMV